MAVECGPSLQLCAVRVTLLDSLGNVSAATDNSYVTDQLISVGANPDIQAGTVQTLTGGCDCTVADYRGDDKLKRFLFALGTAAVEPGLLALLIGADVIDAAGDVIGLTWPGPIQCGTSAPNTAFEFWTKHWNGDFQDATWPWFHHTYPSSSWQIGNQSFQNDFAQPTINGFSRQNQLWGNGPYGDQPAGIDISRGGFYLTATEPPTAECGFQHVVPGS